MRRFAIAALILTVSSPSFAWTTWETSPNNWNNSPMNWENSSMNWNNSPMNWNNSRMNINRSNGIYSESGESFGYFTPKAGGGFNIFGNDGSRFGFIR